MNQKDSKFNAVMSYVSLGLGTIIILAHVFYKPVDLLILLIPAMMMGLDISNFLKK